VSAAKAEALIRHYFDMCNAADWQGLPNAPWRGSKAIADGWVWCVNTLGSKWTIEKVLTSADGREAVIEWTHWKTGINEVLRGDEWYIFNNDVTRIAEIRAYYASPVDKTNALHDFDYAGRGYHLAAPAVPGRD
jgi:hypothetical protein